MKQKEVFKKIGGIIQELSDQYEYLQTVTDDLNDLELELFVSNAHFLTDHIEILCKLNLQNKLKRPTIEKPETPYEQKFFEPMVQQMKHGSELKEPKTPKAPINAVVPEITSDKPAEEDTPVPQIDLTSGSPEDTYAVIQEEPETIRHELVLDEADTWEEEEGFPAIEEEESKDSKKRKNGTPAAIEEPVVLPVTDEAVLTPEKVEDKPVSTEPEKDEVITRNQKISSQLGDKATSKTEQLSIKPISDIKLAITLNDKLLYVKDLFNGYNLAYSEAIEILNRFNTFEEAQRFLKTNYVTKNNWEGKPATTEKFYALLKRRYA